MAPISKHRWKFWYKFPECGTTSIDCECLRRASVPPSPPGAILRLGMGGRCKATVPSLNHPSHRGRLDPAPQTQTWTSPLLHQHGASHVLRSVAGGACSPWWWWWLFPMGGCMGCRYFLETSGCSYFLETSGCSHCPCGSNSAGTRGTCTPKSANNDTSKKGYAPSNTVA